MGGGDLNLKKSWHPSTLRNIERVWKAEQKHEAEQQKIEQLQKELAAERAREEIHAYAEDQGVLKRRDERLDWMYQGPAALVNREDYLLGRKIDKTLELLQMQENGQTEGKEESRVGSIFRPDASTSTVTVDLANKIKEDPLFAIMKREKEQRKNLLNNPIRMKQLKEILEKSLTKEKKKSKKSSEKKSKRRHHSSSSSSSSGSEEAVKYVCKKKGNSEEYKDKSYSSRHQKTSSDGHKKSKHTDHRSHDYHEDARNVERKYRHSDRSSFSSKEKDDRKSIYIKKEYKYSNNSSNFGQHNYREERKHDVKRKLSSAEKERLRQEMMENAKWRESQRQKNVERYIKEGELEDNIGKGNASNFIRPMLSKAAELGSVESRVKQKIFTIQRKKGDMDTNFARR